MSALAKSRTHASQVTAIRIVIYRASAFWVVTEVGVLAFWRGTYNPGQNSRLLTLPTKQLRLGRFDSVACRFHVAVFECLVAHQLASGFWKGIDLEPAGQCARVLRLLQHLHHV